MKEIFWVFKNFGFGAGILFLWDSLFRLIRRALHSLSGKRFPIRFKDLSNHDAQMTAWMVGMPGWEKMSRHQLNQAWDDFVKRSAH